MCVGSQLALKNDLSKRRLSKEYTYRQLNFPSEPGVANEILENEAKSCYIL